MAPPKFKQTMGSMMELFDEMAELNVALTSEKVNTIPNFEELSTRKLAICDELMQRHLQPYETQRNTYIQSNPGIRLADDGFYPIRNHVREEKAHTERSIKNPDYVPTLPAVTMQVVPGKTTMQRMIEAQESMDKETDKLNQQLGGKVFLKRSDYAERSNTKQHSDRITGKKPFGPREL